MPIWAGERSSPDLAELCSAGRVRHRPWVANGDYGVARWRLGDRGPIGDYAVFFSTSAEFFDPNPTQLQIARSI